MLYSSITRILRVLTIMSLPQKITRAQAKRVFLRNRGAAKRLSDATGIYQSSICDWLYGRRNGQRVGDACLKFAAELLAAEERAA